MRKRQLLQQMMEKLDMQEKQTGLLSHIRHKNKHEMRKTRNRKTPRRKHRKHAL